jgi:hypothetical protein
MSASTGFLPHLDELNKHLRDRLPSFFSLSGSRKCALAMSEMRCYNPSDIIFLSERSARNGFSAGYPIFLLEQRKISK